MFGINIEKLIQQFGILAIGAIVFAESGLLIGFFLPGDTLLLLAGVLASQGELPLLQLLAVIVVAAIVGDNVGYSIGRRTGHRIFKKEEGILFHKENIQRAEDFYNKHGGKTIIMARFIPVVRTFAPMVAGIAKMPRRRFMAYNVVGGLLWGVGVTLLGYFVGSKIPHIDKYLHYVVFAVVVGSIAISLLHLLRNDVARGLLIAKLKRLLSYVALNKKVD